MRERSSVLRRRIALTEKRDILGDILAVVGEYLKYSRNSNWVRWVV